MYLDEILSAPDKFKLNFPYGEKSNNYFGDSEVSDILSFGFSFVEQHDHFVDYILVNPDMARRIIREIDDFQITAETEYLGQLWTARIFVTNRVGNSVLFSNKECFTVLELNLNKMEE
jgi:hypothetical protein